MRALSLAARAIVLLLAPTGCALLRSAPRPPEEWTFIAFSGSSPSGRARAADFSAQHTVAVGCAWPNVVTFSVEPCAVSGGALPRSDKSLLIVGNSSPHGYRPDVLRAILSDASARTRFAGQAVALARDSAFGGLLLDFRSLGARDVDALVSLVEAVTDSARAAKAGPVGMVIPVADTAAYPGRHLGALTDFLALLTEAEPATPGPITPLDRMADLVGARAGEIGAHKLMLLMPVDGYIWRSGEPRRRVSFQEAAAIAADWGVAFVRDESTGTLRARAPLRGEIWVNDAELIGRVVRDARRLGIRKFGLYGLGGEDLAIWSSIPRQPVRR